MNCVDKSPVGCPAPDSYLSEAKAPSGEPIEREGFDDSGQSYALPANGILFNDIAAARAEVEYQFGRSPFRLAADASFTFLSGDSPADEPVGIQPASLKLHQPTGRVKLSVDF